MQFILINYQAKYYEDRNDQWQFKSAHFEIRLLSYYCINKHIFIYIQYYFDRLSLSRRLVMIATFKIKNM